MKFQTASQLDFREHQSEISDGVTRNFRQRHKKFQTASQLDFRELQSAISDSLKFSEHELISGTNERSRSFSERWGSFLMPHVIADS
jgi:hypothetical protein